MATQPLNLQDMRDNLRVSELMIGDWVSTPKGVMKVCSLSQDGALFCSLEACASNWEKFSDYEIRGVPLSIDTLLANGFKGDGEALASYVLNDPESRKKVIINELPDFKIHDLSLYCTVSFCRTPNEEYPIIRGSVYYVHELQHILRFAGIRTIFIREYM